jgi:hypothetical protein
MGASGFRRWVLEMVDVGNGGWMLNVLEIVSTYYRGEM